MGAEQEGQPSPDVDGHPPATPEGRVPRSPNVPFAWHAEIGDAWNRWLRTSQTLGHFDHDIDQPLERHTEECYRGAQELVARISAALSDESGRPPRRILDHGSSTGFKSLALAEAFPSASVVGIDPDVDGLGVGRSIGSHLRDGLAFNPPTYVAATGESLPLPTNSFDAVVSITVLEHVRDVERSLSEIARVLRPGGVLYLEAPNYTWPYEPHLRIPVPPSSSKRAMKFVARRYGITDASFVDHLNLLRPRAVEEALERCGFRWRNLFAEKLERAIAGEARDVVFYGRLARLLSTIGRYGMGGVVRRLTLGTGMYPSLIYVAYRR